MGCDIHAFVETKRDGQWRLCGGPVVVDSRVRKCDPPERLWDYQWIPHRSYADFTLLAGVRAYDPDIVPISEPRGLPDDMSDLLRKIMDEDYHDSFIYEVVGLVPPPCPWPSTAWGYANDAFAVIFGEGSPGDHSASWVTLQELREALANRPPDTHGQLRDLVHKMAIFGEETRLVFNFDN